MKVYTWKLWARRTFLVALVVPAVVMTFFEMIFRGVVEAYCTMTETFSRVSVVYRELWRRTEPAKAEHDELKNEDFWGNC